MRGILRGLCAATVIYAAQSHADIAGQGLSPAPSPEHSPSSIGSDRPNFVFIIVDDMERTMLNALPEGKGRNLTPNLDRLVNEGVLMTGQHVASAVCTPSRYNVLTGQYASRAMPVGPHEQAVVGFDGQSFREILLGASPPEDRVLYSEMGFTRAIRVGDWKYLAIRYPEEVQNMTVEERRRRLEEWNAGLIERGITPVNTDPAAPFSHLSAIPGGAHAEHSTTGKKAHYYDSDQLFHLADDPSEERNLADDPAHAARLAGMKETLKSVLRKLPGSFGEFTRNDPKKESQNALIQ